MPRIRTIKPEFWSDEDLSGLPAETHMLAAALLNHADDEGYFNANPKLVKAVCCPLREDSVSVHKSLELLSEVRYLRLLNGSDGKQYGQVMNFTKHQRVNRPTESKIKGLIVITEDSVSPHGAVTDGSPPERKGKERKVSNSLSLTHAREQTLFPDEFTVNDLVRTRLKMAGCTTNPDDPVVLEKFRSHQISQARMSANWDEAYISWCLKEIAHRGKPSETSQRDSRSRAQRHHDKLKEIAQRSLAKAGGIT